MPSGQVLVDCYRLPGRFHCTFTLMPEVRITVKDNIMLPTSLVFFCSIQMEKHELTKYSSANTVLMSLGNTG